MEKSWNWLKRSKQENMEMMKLKEEYETQIWIAQQQQCYWRHQQEVQRILKHIDYALNESQTIEEKEADRIKDQTEKEQTQPKYVRRRR